MALGSLSKAIVTAIEAKSAVLNKMDIRTPDGVLAKCTARDTVTIAITGLGPLKP